MRIFKTTFIFLFIFANFAQNVFADTGPSERVRRIRDFLQREEGPESTIDVNVKTNIPYDAEDNDPLKRLDTYVPKNTSSKVPVLIHFHGGGWRVGDKNQTIGHGLFYANKNISFVSVNYRLSPEVMHPAHVEDCAAAVAWVFNNIKQLKGDADRVFISGHSAGAHLAALLGADPSYLDKYGLSIKKIAGVIPVDNASFDLVSRYNENVVKPMIEDAFGNDEKILTAASPIHNIGDKHVYPKFLIPVSGNRPSAIEQAKEFNKKLKSVGVESEVIVVDEHTHREMNLGMFDPDDPVARSILSFILNKDN